MNVDTGKVYLTPDYARRAVLRGERIEEVDSTIAAESIRMRAERAQSMRQSRNIAASLLSLVQEGCGCSTRKRDRMKRQAEYDDRVLVATRPRTTSLSGVGQGAEPPAIRD